METFNEKLIKRETGALTFERGEKLYLNGGIKAFSSEKEGSSKLREIHAQVKEDMVSENINNAYILLNYKREAIEEFNCDCSEFKSSRKNKACRHIVAAYLREIRGQEKIKGKDETTLSSDYINKIKEINKREEALIKKPVEKRALLNLNFILGFNIHENLREITVEFMIGEDRTYTVSDARDFLNSFKYKNYTVSCEGSFAFKPKEHYFNERDTVFLNILSAAPIIKSSMGLYDRKKIIINTETLELIFQILYGRSFNLEVNNRICKKARLISKDLPLKFELTKLGEGDWILKQLDELPIDLTGQEKYFFYNENIYIPTIQQVKDYSEYYKELIDEKDNTISIKKSSGKVKHEIIPLLKNISESIEILDKSKETANALNKLFENINFKTCMELDKTLSGISLSLKFIYGHIELDMFSDDKFKAAGKINNRQLQKEIIIIDMIKELGFEITRKSFVMQEEGKILDFLSEGIDKLRKIGEVTLSDSFRNLRVYDTSDYKVSASIREDGLLEFGFSIKGISSSEFKKIFESVKNNDKYYKLLNGGYISLSDKTLRNLINLANYLEGEGSLEEGGRLLASKYNALYVEQYLKENEFLYVEKNKKYKELVENIEKVKDIDFTLPDYLEKVMRPYQKVGFKWLKTLGSYGFGGILSDEMGLGKTLQAIAFIASEAVRHENPVLVVVPTSLVYNWEMEVEKFAPNLKTLILYGKKSERLAKLEDIKDYDLIITSYAVLRNDISYFEELEFSYCFIDEAQQIKNAYTGNAKAVKKIKAKGYFALTGTPMENSLLELWSVFDFIMPGYLLSKTRFNKVYGDPIIVERDKNALEALKKHITPFMLRRLKSEVMTELPPKIEQRLVVDMTEEQKAVYMSYVHNARNQIRREFETQGFGKNKINILSALTRLRQVCCDPSVVLPDYEGDSSKMLALSDLLDEALNADHRLLIFSQFTSVLQKIALMLRQKDIDYFYLDGSTKSEDRLAMAEEFNDGNREVFLVSLKAGGFGLNLTGADIVIHFDPWWNPAVEDQATDRAHRIGQTKTVEVIKLIAKGTIEEKIFKLQEKKKDIIEQVVKSSAADSNIISSLTKEDFEELFSYEETN